MQKYVFRKYDPKYRSLFILEKKKLIRFLYPKTKIEHIGSTAVPDLGGKNILDITIGVSRSKFESTRKILINHGYEFYEDKQHPERLFFVKDHNYKNRKERIHIHLTKFNGKDWKEMISFRDYLLKNRTAAEQYALIKKASVKKALGNGKKYRKYKEKFIKDALIKIFKK